MAGYRLEWGDILVMTSTQCSAQCSGKYIMLRTPTVRPYTILIYAMSGVGSGAVTLFPGWRS